MVLLDHADCRKEVGAAAKMMGVGGPPLWDMYIPGAAAPGTGMKAGAWSVPEALGLTSQMVRSTATMHAKTVCQTQPFAPALGGAAARSRSCAVRSSMADNLLSRPLMARRRTS